MDEILTSLHQHRVDGLLLVGLDDPARVRSLVEQGTPVVVLDRIGDDSPASSVSIDNAAAARAATEHLLGHGYDTIGLIGGPSRFSTSRDRRRGFTAALAHAGVETRDEWMLEAGFSKQAGFEIGSALFARGSDLPRAFFVANDQQAIGLLRAAHEAGVAVPEQLAIVTFDGTDDSAYSVPPLSTVRQPVEQIAREAVALLVQAGASEPTRIVCDFDLVIRRSCGCGDGHD